MYVASGVRGGGTWATISGGAGVHAGSVTIAARLRVRRAACAERTERRCAWNMTGSLGAKKRRGAEGAQGPDGIAAN